MLSASAYIPRGIVSEPLYQKIIEAMDYVIQNNENDFKDILNKYKDFTNQQGQATKETLKEFGFENIIKILDIPDSTAARLAYFINAISMFKGHKEGLILVTRLLGGFAFITEWYDGWVGYSSKDFTIGTIYAPNDTVIATSSIDGIEYLYVCAIGGAAVATPAWPIYLNEIITDGVVTWINIGKAQKVERWQPNKIYKAGQHVFSNTATRYVPSTGSTNIAPPNTPYPYPPPPLPTTGYDTQGRDYIFECQVGGVSGASEPVAWNKNINLLTVDNAITWKTLDPEAYFTFNITWTFPPGITTPHTFDYFKAFVRSYVYPVLVFWIIAPVGSFQFSQFPLWQPNTLVNNNMFLYPSTGHYPIMHYAPGMAFVYECTNAMVPDTGAVEPIWPLVINATVLDSNGNEWTCRNDIPQLGLGFADWDTIGGMTIPIWTASTVMNINDVVTPTITNLYGYKCIHAGITDITEPSIVNPTPNPWPTTIGDTVVDNPGPNQIIWQCCEIGGVLSYLY